MAAQMELAARCSQRRGPFRGIHLPFSAIWLGSLAEPDNGRHTGRILFMGDKGARIFTASRLTKCQLRVFLLSPEQIPVVKYRSVCLSVRRENYLRMLHR